MQATVCLVFCFLFPLVRVISGNMYLTDRDASKVIEFTYNYPHCQVHVDREEIVNLLAKYPHQFVYVETEALNKIEEPCRTRKQHGFIYPGTFWCGPGTRAVAYWQLGEHTGEDKCCRDHDNCPLFLAAGQCLGDVCNTSRFTRSHCDCDKKFQECLRNTGTETGNTIGAIFFNVAQIYCFKERNCTDNERLVSSNEINGVEVERRICPVEFALSRKYEAGPPYFTLKNKKAFFLNLLLRKINVL